MGCALSRGGSAEGKSRAECSLSVWGGAILDIVQGRRAVIWQPERSSGASPVPPPPPSLPPPPAPSAACSSRRLLLPPAAHRCHCAVNPVARSGASSGAGALQAGAARRQRGGQVMPGAAAMPVSGGWADGRGRLHPPAAFCAARQRMVPAHRCSPACRPSATNDMHAAACPRPVQRHLQPRPGGHSGCSLPCLHRGAPRRPRSQARSMGHSGPGALREPGTAVLPVRRPLSRLCCARRRHRRWLGLLTGVPAASTSRVGWLSAPPCFLRRHRRGATAAAVVFDITSQQSFRRAQVRRRQ